MQKIATIKPITVDGKKCTAVVGMVVVNKDIYVLTTHSQDGSKQPCVLHKFYNNGSYKQSVIKTETGKTNIAVHANSLTYQDHVFYMATRNGAGETYNQIIGFKSDGSVVKKIKYLHPKSKIATVNIYKGRWYITVNGGNHVKFRQVSLSGDKLTDVDERILDFYSPTDAVGNDITIADDTIYATKTYADMITNEINTFDLKTLRNDRKFVLKDGYSKFEVEGCYPTDSGLLICVNGVVSGKQDDGVWRL